MHVVEEVILLRELIELMLLTRLLLLLLMLLIMVNRIVCRWFSAQNFADLVVGCSSKLVVDDWMSVDLVLAQSRIDVA